jgi:hypothetical protein
VAASEHAADGAENYDGEDGDDDAIWKGLELVHVLVGCVMRFLLFFRLFAPPLSGLSTSSLSRAYHVHALKAETTGFIVVEVRRVRSWCWCCLPNRVP